MALGFCGKFLQLNERGMAARKLRSRDLKSALSRRGVCCIAAMFMFDVTD